MKEKPILFSGEMVRAILEGRKVQTRRVIKPQPVINGHGVVTGPEKWHATGGLYYLDDWKKVVTAFHCPYGVPGCHLWVRETWRGPRELDRIKPSELNQDISLWWEADHSSHRWLSSKPGKVRPSIFMPRWASRITLEIKAVRVEMVQEITKEDILAEGLPDRWQQASNICHLNSWIDLWDSINAKRGYGWKKNPWVWVIEFQHS